MNYRETVKSNWQDLYRQYTLESPAVRRTLGRDITTTHYESLLAEIYHYTKNSPQIIWLAASSIPFSKQATMKKFIRHGLSEVGHHDLALDDLETLGVGRSIIANSRPLPATRALDAYARHQSHFKGILGYLGYMFYLEYIPTQGGSLYLDAFRDIGVPDRALSFIKEHVVADEGHNKAMESYIDELVHTNDDLREFLDCMETTAHLYTRMIEEAYARADLRQEHEGH